MIVSCVTLAARETDEDEDTPNYEEKAQEIVQSILQDVVNTVAGGEFHFVGWIEKFLHFPVVIGIQLN